MSNYGRVDIPSVLATVPMWFDLLDQDKAQRMLNLLAGPDHETDWGMRIISSQEPKLQSRRLPFWIGLAFVSQAGRRSANIAIIALLRHTPIFARTPCWG